jgi:predicted amino acid-binding ACT domain protein
MTGKQHRFVLSVLVPDRVGILRDISTSVAGLGANIDGISQTVTAGYFTVILTITVDKSISAETVRESVVRAFPEGEASVVVRNHEPQATRAKRKPLERYVVTATGADRSGILKTVTSYLAEKGINIEDWYVLFEGTHVTHIGEVSVPSILDIKQVQSDLQQRLSPMGLTVGFQHENIFRVTHEVGAVRPLIVGRPHA